ncbi:hypothetical protein RW86_03430 [Escherichia coli]|nr:hypothetical protein RW85_02889 [Escherichia coli]OYA58234.1 hypothetical protein RW86_03430 [Escherichia coli]
MCIYLNLMILIKIIRGFISVEWVFYDGRYWLDFRKSKEGIRCISCSILYHDKSKGRIDVLFSEGIADRGLKNTGGVLIQKRPQL